MVTRTGMFMREVMAESYVMEQRSEELVLPVIIPVADFIGFYDGQVGKDEMEFI